MFPGYPGTDAFKARPKVSKLVTKGKSAISRNLTKSQGDAAHTNREGAGVLVPQAQACRDHQKLEEDCFLKPLGGA